MGITGWWQWVIVLVIVLLLFGRGKIPELMGDVAKGIRNFKNGMSNDDDEEVIVKDDTVPPTVDHRPAETVETTKSSKEKARKG